jgi:antitoxin (DNA-binding transcriptional repressor) of toxin-antitoxin stability system
LDEIVSLTENGNEVIITAHEVPRARIVPLAARQPRVPGLHQGSIQTTDDFDAPPPDDLWACTQ